MSHSYGAVYSIECDDLINLILICTPGIKVEINSKIQSSIGKKMEESK